MTRSYKAISISFFVLAFLVGCGDDEPSSSDIEKQLLSQLSPCPELSITDFQKLNGYPQNDGSYIDQVQYNLVFMPSDNMLKYVSDFINKQQSIESEGAADTAKATKLEADAQSMENGCMSTYQLELPGQNTALAAASNVLNTAFNSSSNPLLFGNDPNSNVGEIEGFISQGTNTLQYEQKVLSDDENPNRWAQQNAAAAALGVQAGTITPAESQVLALDNERIEAVKTYIKDLNEIKANILNIVSQYSTCHENVQKIYAENQPAIDHIKELSAEMSQANNDDLTALKNEMNKDCPIVVIGGVLGMFTPDAGIEAYGKTYKLAESGTVHLVKSDNGWMIQ